MDAENAYLQPLLIFAPSSSARAILEAIMSDKAHLADLSGFVAVSGSGPREPARAVSLIELNSE